MQDLDEAENEEDASETLWQKFVNSFNFGQNSQMIFSGLKQGYFNLSYLDGVRALCLIYLIYANDYWARLSLSQNLSDEYYLKTFMKSWTYLFLSGSMYTIDLFFFVSGLSSFLVYYKKLEEKKFNQWTSTWFFKSLFTKWMQVVPLFFVLETLYTQVMPATVDGPVQSLTTDFTVGCIDGGFWYSFFMIGNLETHAQCMTWCWYLAAELQCFFLVLFAIMLFKSKRSLGWLMLGIWGVFGWGMSAFMWLYNGLKIPVNTIPRESVHDHYFVFYYAQSFCRCAPYMIGAAIGALILTKFNNETEEKIKNNNKSVVALTDLEREGAYCSSKNSPRNRSNDDQVLEWDVKYDWIFAWACTIGGFLFMLMPIFIFRFYQQNSENWSETSQLLYELFGRLSFILGALLIGLPGFYQKTSIALMFLGGSFWTPMSRMFYGMYMIHMLLINYNLAQSYAFQYMDNLVIQNYVFADLFFSFILSYILVAMIEMPFYRLTKKLIW